MFLEPEQTESYCVFKKKKNFFIGLSVSESAKLCNYMHFREPVILNEKTLLQRANLDKAIDFMDTLEEDIPRGEYLLLLFVLQGQG